eukprot:g39920.t1
MDDEFHIYHSLYWRICPPVNIVSRSLKVLSANSSDTSNTSHRCSPWHLLGSYRGVPSSYRRHVSHTEKEETKRTEKAYMVVMGTVWDHDSFAKGIYFYCTKSLAVNT